MQFTTRQKFTLSLSIYVLIFIAIVGAIFFLILHTVLIYQVQKDTTTATVNVLKNHVAVEGGSIVVVKDKTGGLLSDEVTESNISILLLDNDLKVVESYGILELYDQGDEESVKTIARMAKDTSSLQKSYTKTVSWRGQNLSVYVAPIKNSGQIYGAIVAAKSKAEIESLERVIIFTLLGLIISSIIVSLLLSRLLVKRIFKPIQALTEIVSAADLDKLDKKLMVTGSNSDELVILGDKFNQMMIRLKSMSEQQKEFITNASHELKTPLSRAISSLDLSLSQDKPDSKTLTDIREDLFEINNLLDKLMFLSKLRPGTILPSDHLSLNRVIKETVAVFGKELKNKRISILTRLDPDTTIVIPKEYAKVLLRNLLSNAVKYSRENSIVSIQTKKTNTITILKITDQGPGINKFDLDNVEKRFYRGKESGTVSGHGIGLAIVRRIVDLYKIRFSIESNIGKGTKVTLEFPIS